MFTYVTTLQKKINSKTKGFTLIEALVSLGLFSIVIVTASGVILSILNSNRKNQAISSVVNNLNYSVESMVRDIKTGYGYQCGLTYDGPNDPDFILDAYKLLDESCDGVTSITDITLVSTITGEEQIVRYELSGTGVDAYIKKTLYTETGGSVAAVSYPLTDTKNIEVDLLGFTVRTPPPIIPAPDGETTGQPSVFLVMKGKAKVNNINVSDFFIQTFISQRLPNFI
jgi:prepilin-type N-terminal cleavage/methylation domain-containing protein